MSVLKAPGPLPDNLKLSVVAMLDFAKGGSARVMEHKALGIQATVGRPTRKDDIVVEITAAHLPGEIFGSYQALKEAWNGKAKSEPTGSNRREPSGKGRRAVGDTADKANAGRKKRVQR